MRSIRARDGNDIAYLADGQGPPVVLLHGATSEGRHTWAADPPRIGPLDLRRVTVPAVVAVGDADPFCPVEQAGRLKRELPAAGLFVSPGCGHELHSRRPDLFVDVALALFRTAEARLASGGSAPGGSAPGESAPDPSPGADGAPVADDTGRATTDGQLPRHRVTDPRPLVRVDLPARRPRADGQGDPVDGVALVTLDRRVAMNALSAALLRELAEACERLGDDPACRVVVVTGAGTRAFATGADIGEMAGEDAAGLEAGGRFDDWDALARLPMPTIAAVRGYALGGGAELAMSCDMIVAGDDARFGQPEITLGVMPGAGATQRLTRAVGKARAMELILTGRTFDAHEAAALGLVTRVVPAGETLDAALELAATIAAMPPLAVRAARHAVTRAHELPLSDGLRVERQLFYRLFGTEDKAEGMAAFLEKRSPAWKGR